MMYMAYVNGWATHEMLEGGFEALTSLINFEAQAVPCPVPGRWPKMVLQRDGRIQLYAELRTI